MLSLVHTKGAVACTVQMVGQQNFIFIVVKPCSTLFTSPIYIITDKPLYKTSFRHNDSLSLGEPDCKLSQTSLIDFQTKKKSHAKKITGFQVINHRLCFPLSLPLYLLWFTKQRKSTMCINSFLPQIHVNCLLPLLIPGFEFWMVKTPSTSSKVKFYKSYH